MPNVQHKRGTRAALNALAAAGELLPGQIHVIADEGRLAVALTASTYQAFAKQSEAGGGGGADPWTRVYLASDFVNAATSFVTITDGTAALSWTPPANSDYTVEAELLLQTATGSNLPRVGVSVGAGQAHGAVEIMQPGSLASSSPVFLAGSFGTAAVNVQISAGTLPGPNTPYLARMVVKGRSGASPGAIALQMAAEAAAADTCRIRAGSEMRTRAA